ncbi:GATA transcription factor 4-like [Canna indica]|uniref:GATA transcription factor 4-like n=1 Tax=Canna indica TaxID=4628 RepID=A0AAQ3KNJ4_9LILI|nr:GATA transcription factor 4-like [Canna indica]
MAWEWEMKRGLEFGMGMGDGATFSTTISSSVTVAQFESAPSPTYIHCPPPADDALLIDDILDFSGHDLLPSTFAMPSAATADSQFFAHFSPDANQSLPGEVNSSFRPQQGSFDFHIPREEAAELEWLSQLVEDSFSDVPCQFTGLAAASGDNQPHVDEGITGDAARSKRPRTGNATDVWSALTQPPQASPASSSSSSDLPSHKPNWTIDNGFNSTGDKGKKEKEGGASRCTHCASEKTPQWRTGPLGPKTLCNACGVRYKSGRLVPEYRPAASPTFVLSQHSNSHRKVMELRRQKELLLFRHENQLPSTSSSAITRSELLLDGYGVC